MINEDFLHYIWQHKLLIKDDLKTSKNEKIAILDTGRYNTNSGPDFLGAKVRIANTIWAGHIEIHIKSSDWYAHQHVILHVVWIDDVPVKNTANLPIPTLVLQPYLSQQILNNYQKLYSKKVNWIACEGLLEPLPELLLQNWYEALFIERLAQKSQQVKNLLLAKQSDFEAVFFSMIAMSFGLHLNKEAFLNLAQSLPFTVIRKLSVNKNQLEAVFFGQAGFLQEEMEEDYHRQLRKEYNYLKIKHQLTPIFHGQFKFFRLRPANFPTTRIAQLAALYRRHINLMDELMACKTLKDIEAKLDILPDEYWTRHYNFGLRSKKRKLSLTTSFKHLVIINAVLPFLWVYQEAKNKYDPEVIIKIMRSIPTEHNRIINNFKSLGFISKDALSSQALLELKKQYCDKKRCLDCRIGHYLLQRH